MRKRFFLFAVFLLVGCSRQRTPDEKAFEACYSKCMQPAPNACPAEHMVCVTACRTGQDPIYRAMPRFASGPAPDVQGRSQLSQSVAIETVGGEATPILRRCIDLPFEATDIFTTSEANQPTIEVHLVAGESPKAGDNQSLGSWTFQGVRPAPAAIPRIQVRFSAAKSGRLAIGARDLDTGKDLTVLQKGMNLR
jgi:molecular chaperone DnaK (HSP70)